MERSPQIPQVPDLNDFETRGGLRQSAQRMYNYLLDQRRKLQSLFSQVATDLTYLYGELDYVGVPLAVGATGLGVIVSGSIPGFAVTVTYDQDLQGIIAYGYVASNDIVNIVLLNSTGGPITLANGKFRVYVTPRNLL